MSDDDTLDKLSEALRAFEEMDKDDPRYPKAAEHVLILGRELEKARDRSAAKSSPLFPQDLPLLRDTMARFYCDDLDGAHAKQALQTLIASLMNQAENDDPVVRVNEIGRRLTAEQLDLLTSAELFFVAEPLAQLLEHAHTGMGAAGFESHDLPAPTGLAYLDLDMPVGTPDGIHYQHGERILFAWRNINAATPAAPRGRCEVTTYIDRERSSMAAVVNTDDPVWRAMPKFLWDDVVDIAYGDPATDTITHDRGRSPFSRQWWQERRGPMFRALCYLLQQRVTSSVVEDPTRATRKLVKRRGGDPAPIRVITLRGASGGGIAGSGNREYVHQWMVRGHWRRQWYSTMQQHRPVFVAPYVKGPDGAPMLGGEKVYRAVAPTTSEEQP